METNHVPGNTNVESSYTIESRSPSMNNLFNRLFPTMGESIDVFPKKVMTHKKTANTKQGYNRREVHI